MDQVNRAGGPGNSPLLIQRPAYGTWPSADQLSRIWSDISRPMRPLIGAVIFGALKFLITGSITKNHILDVPFIVCLVLAVREQMRTEMADMNLEEQSIWVTQARIMLGIIGLNPEQAPLPQARHLHEHFQPGGLNEQFENQSPTGAQIQAIHSFIKPRCKALVDHGITKGGVKLHLLDRFNSSEVVEWCALKASEGHFSLVEATTAIALIQRGSTNPISRKPFQTSDFIRGKALTDLFNLKMLVLFQYSYIEKM